MLARILICFNLSPFLMVKWSIGQASPIGTWLIVLVVRTYSSRIYNKRFIDFQGYVFVFKHYIVSSWIHRLRLLSCLYFSYLNFMWKIHNKLWLLAKPFHFKLFSKGYYFIFAKEQNKCQFHWNQTFWKALIIQIKIQRIPQKVCYLNWMFLNWPNELTSYFELIFIY